LFRWAEHLKELLNCVNPTDPTLVDLILQLPIIPQLDHPPAFYEVEVAVEGPKNNKSTEPDGIPAEVFKHGGHHLIHRLQQFIHRAWTTGKNPRWRTAAIVKTVKSSYLWADFDEIWHDEADWPPTGDNR